MAVSHFPMEDGHDCALLHTGSVLWLAHDDGEPDDDIGSTLGPFVE
jgi:hypothetical protein